MVLLLGHHTKNNQVIELSSKDEWIDWSDLCSVKGTMGRNIQLTMLKYYARDPRAKHLFLV